MRTLIVLSLFTSLGLAQPKGTVNGHPIDDRVFTQPDQQKVGAHVLNAGGSKLAVKVQADRCGGLLYAIGAILREDQAKALGVVVTDADIEGARKTVESLAETFKRGHASSVALAAALDAVDKGEDPGAVHERLLKSTMPPVEWDRMRSDPVLRKAIRASASETWEDYQKKQGALFSADLRAHAKRSKLDQRVDEQLALGDSTFGKYLVNSKRPMANQGSPERFFSNEQRMYLKQKRDAYWADIDAHAQVFINDPGMQGCDLSRFNGGKK